MMGKDLPAKNLLNCPDVFADITNVNLFDGEDLPQSEEYLDMMAAFSNDTRFARIKETVLSKRKAGEESVTMFSIAEELENVGRQKGVEEGKKEVICNMLRDEQSPELISKYTEEPLEYIYQVQQEMVSFAREETAYKIGKN